MNRGSYVGFITIDSKRWYLQIDGTYALSWNKARRFKSGEEALSAAQLDKRWSDYPSNWERIK